MYEVLISPRYHWPSRAGTLNSYAAQKGAVDKVTGEELYDLVVRSKHRCHWCGWKLKVGRRSAKRRLLTFDHKIRLADDGTNTIDNLVVACFQCNSNRH